jgi:hypothetical protein
MRVQPERSNAGMAGLARAKAQKVARSCTEGVGAPGVRAEGRRRLQQGLSMEKEERRVGPIAR